MTTFSATYSPEDNKLRLYASTRLDAETYARVKAAGFRWAPKQDLFFAPAWSPGREDLLIELAGEIEDEDKSLVERAEERAERFEGYSENRMQDATRAREAVSAIADNIPFGQPILVGHHSERHARRDAEKIERGMRKAVTMWKTAQYWEGRAAGAIAAAKYKERPDVRARRIKGLEADLRKQEKRIAESASETAMWRKVLEINDPDRQRKTAEHIANYSGHWSMSFPLAKWPRELPASQYEGPMGLWSAITGGVITPVQAAELAIAAGERYEPRGARWVEHYQNRLAYERAMLAAEGGTATDKTGPEKGGAVKCWASHRGGWSYINKVNKVTVTVLDNWGNGGGNFGRNIPFDKLTAVMTKAEVEAARADGRLVEAGDGTGFFLKDKAPEEAPAAPEPAPAVEAQPEPKAAGADLFAGMEASLKAGVQVTVAPQLFETPRDLAAARRCVAALAANGAPNCEAAKEARAAIAQAEGGAA